MTAAETASYAGRALDELPDVWEGMARLVRAGMGITAFGANVFELPPDYLTESHDEAESGQQELYVVLCIGGVPGAPYVAPPNGAACRSQQDPIHSAVSRV